MLTQVWGSDYYHMLVESLSRMTVVLDILLQDPDIKVYVRGMFGVRIQAGIGEEEEEEQAEPCMFLWAFPCDRVD